MQARRQLPGSGRSLAGRRICSPPGGLAGGCGAGLRGSEPKSLQEGRKQRDPHAHLGPQGRCRHFPHHWMRLTWLQRGRCWGGGSEAATGVRGGARRGGALGEGGAEVKNRHWHSSPSRHLVTSWFSDLVLCRGPGLPSVEATQTPRFRIQVS